MNFVATSGNQNYNLDMNTIISGITSLPTTVGPFFILLGLLIFVHELGHFLVAKYFGVRVETFSLGFGKKLLKYKRGDTTYCISMIPLGGYVKMYGDDTSAEIPEEEKKHAFLHKPVSQRIAVVLAGPLMNLFFAALIFTFIAGLGELMPGPMAGDIPDTAPAYEAGFRSGDKILSINGQETPTWIHIRKKIEEAGGQALSFAVERRGEPQPLELQAAVGFGPNENIFSSNRTVGQIPGLVQESRSTVVGVKDPQSPAALAGIKTLDVLVSINGTKVSYWRDLQHTALRAMGDDTKALTLQVRDISAEEKPENLRTFEVAVRPGWNEKTNLMDWLGLEPSELYIYQVKKDSPAGLAGLQAKDKVIRIDGEDIHTWADVLARVKSFTGETMEFAILRDGKESALKIKPEMTTLMTNKGQEEKRYTIGIVSGFFPVGGDPVFYRTKGFLPIIKTGIRETANWTEFVVMSMVRLISGDVSAKNIGGVITIGRVASNSFEAGISTFLKTMAVISINLFLLNMLPIPILDGGHLVFYTIEALKGTPLSMRKMEIAQQVGLMLLMFLMVFAFFNDLTNLFSNRW